jgi:hypothetical protein
MRIVSPDKNIFLNRELTLSGTKGLTNRLSLSLFRRLQRRMLNLVETSSGSENRSIPSPTIVTIITIQVTFRESLRFMVRIKL